MADAAAEGEVEEPIKGLDLTEEAMSKGLSGLAKTMDGKSVVMTVIELPGTAIEEEPMKLGDITVLSRLNHIRHVNIMDNLVRDLSPLLGLDQILSLNASGNKIESVDLPTMPFLQLLDLSGNAIKGPFTCPEMPCLRHLLLSNNQIEGISGLKASTQLQKLELHKNKLTSCEGVGTGSIRQITLHENQIADVKGLEEMNLVTSLDLSDNALTKLEGLAGCGALTSLTVVRNQIGSLDEGVKGHIPESVTSLDLAENPIMEGLDRVQVLVALQKLKKLNTVDITPEETAAADLIINPPPPEAEEPPPA